MLEKKTVKYYVLYFVIYTVVALVYLFISRYNNYLAFAYAIVVLGTIAYMAGKYLKN